MIAKTQAELRALVRFYTDKVNDTARFPDADIDIQLDFGLQCYHAALTKTMNWVEVRSYEFTTTSANTYAMPLHYKTVAVDIKSGDKWVPCRRANMFQAGHIKRDSTNGGRRRARYSEHIENDDQILTLHRHEATVGDVYRLRYIPPSRTITGEQPPDYQYLFPNGWEEVPVLEAAIRILARDKEDDTQLRALLASAYLRMDAEASTSDIFQRPTAVGTFDLEIDDREGY